MKNVRLRLCLVLLPGLAVLIAGVVTLYHSGGKRPHHEVQNVIADARTAAAAVRYLLEPDLPDTTPANKIQECYASNYYVSNSGHARMLIIAPVPSPSQPTNITSLLASNDVIRTQINLTTPS